MGWNRLLCRAGAPRNDKKIAMTKIDCFVVQVLLAMTKKSQ